MNSSKQQKIPFLTSLASIPFEATHDTLISIHVCQANGFLYWPDKVNNAINSLCIDDTRSTNGIVKQEEAIPSQYGELRIIKIPGTEQNAKGISKMALMHNRRPFAVIFGDASNRVRYVDLDEAFTSEEKSLSSEIIIEGRRCDIFAMDSTGNGTICAIDAWDNTVFLLNDHFHVVAQIQSVTSVIAADDSDKDEESEPFTLVLGVTNPDQRYDSDQEFDDLISVCCHDEKIWVSTGTSSYIYIWDEKKYEQPPKRIRFPDLTLTKLCSDKKRYVYVKYLTQSKPPRFGVMKIDSLNCEIVDDYDFGSDVVINSIAYYQNINTKEEKLLVMVDNHIEKSAAIQIYRINHQS